MKTIGLYVDCITLWTGSFAFARKNNLGSGPRVNYKLLPEKLRECFPGSKLAVQRAYVGAKPGVMSDAFQIAMESFGYEVKTVGAAGTAGDRTARSAIYTDVTKELSGWDVVVLATQDPYYLPLAEELRGAGKAVFIADFPPHPAEYGRIGNIGLDESLLFFQPERRV